MRTRFGSPAPHCCPAAIAAEVRQSLSGALTALPNAFGWSTTSECADLSQHRCYVSTLGIGQSRLRWNGIAHCIALQL